MTEQDCISFIKVAQLACAMASRPGDGAGANGDEEENRATADGGLGDEDERAARALQLDEEGDQDGARPGGEIGEWGAVSPLGPPPENVPAITDRRHHHSHHHHHHGHHHCHHHRRHSNIGHDHHNHGEWRRSW